MGGPGYGNGYGAAHAAGWPNDTAPGAGWFIYWTGEGFKDPDEYNVFYTRAVKLDNGQAGQYYYRVPGPVTVCLP